MPVRSNKRRPIPASPHHPLRLGAKAPVFITVDDGEPTFEGWARIVSACISYAHWYRVRFEHEQVDLVRLIFPSSIHDDPALSCVLLRQLLRTRGSSPFDEFFAAPAKWKAKPPATKA